MHAQHKTLLARIKAKQRKQATHQFSDSYLASGHDYFSVPVPERRAIARAWLGENKDIAPREFLALLGSLIEGRSHEEKTLATMLLALSKPLRAHVTLQTLDAWLDHLVGWAEIDSLCSNIFKPDEVLGARTDWERFLKRLARDKNINKRRAALVFLTGPVRYSADKRLLALAFETIDRLKSEREIIITKAISWLLRNLITQHKKAVADYIAKNKASLPAVAVRETARKIKTGKK